MRNAGVTFRSSELVFGRHEKSAIEVLNFKIGLRVVLTARRRCRPWKTAPDNVFIMIGLELRGLLGLSSLGLLSWRRHCLSTLRVTFFLMLHRSFAPS